MTDIMEAIGNGLFEQYQGMLDHRREIIERYGAAFRSMGIKTLNHYRETHRLGVSLTSQEFQRSIGNRRMK